MGVKISNLPNIVTPALTDVFPVVQSGVTFKETFTQLSSLLETTGVNSTITSLTGLTGGIVGTATNDNAAAGYIGEFISSVVLVGAPVAMTSGVAANITSISLTAGDWDVWGSFWTNPAAGTTTSTVIAAVSQTSATLPTTPAIGTSLAQIRGLATGATETLRIEAPITRISLAATTTIYLVCSVTFAVSTMDGYGSLCARRAR